MKLLEGCTAAMLLGAGCATAPEEPVRAPTELERLRDLTNGYTAFHLLAELTVGERSVPVEMAWRAPDRALLRYGENSRVLFEGGLAKIFVGKDRYEVDYGGELSALEDRYGLPVPGGRPEPVFVLEGWEAMLKQRAPRATLAYRRLGPRLGWLAELGRYTVEGRTYRWGAIEIDLREDGFIETARVGRSGGFRLKQLSFEPPPDSVFEPPDGTGFRDVGAQLRPRQIRALEIEYHRWVLQDAPDDRALDALVSVDLARKYEPRKMTDVLRANLRRTIDAYRQGNEAVDPAFLKAKLGIERGRAEANSAIMEQKIHRDFERDLDRYVQGMDPRPPARTERKLLTRWRAAVDRAIETQIRAPFRQVFEDALKS